MSELGFRILKFVLLFSVLGPFIGGVIFGLVIGVYSGDGWLMLAVPFSAYFVGVLPGALTGLGTSIVSLFLRNPRMAIGAGTLIGAIIAPLVFALGASSPNAALLLALGAVGAVSALSCLWIAYHLDWLERST